MAEEKNETKGVEKSLRNGALSNRKKLQKLLKSSKAASFTLQKLETLESEYRNAFQDPVEKDSLWQAFQELVKQRKQKKRDSISNSLGAEPSTLTVKRLLKTLEKSKKELPKGDPLIHEILVKLEERQKSHRVPLANEVDEAESLTLKELDSLERRCVLELPEDDNVFKTLNEIIDKAKTLRKEPLITKYKAFVNDISNISVIELSSFVKELEQELPMNDPLVAQVHALQKAKVMNKPGEEQAKVKVISKEKRRKKKSKLNMAKDLDLELGTETKKGGSSTIFTAIRNDISGFYDSNLYKLCLVTVFLLYCGMMYYTLQLVFKISPFTFSDILSSLFNSNSGSSGGSDDQQETG